MASTTRSYHRRIGEEQWRSICQNCFLTVAEADCEEGLKEGEKPISVGSLSSIAKTVLLIIRPSRLQRR